MRTLSVHSFSNFCEQLMFSMATEGPLSETEAKLIEYYCKEILLKVTSRAPHRSDGSVLPVEPQLE
jgi:hypothetical protein